MHKAITILMLKLECQVIDRNPDFKMQDRDFLRRINWEKRTVMVNGREYPMRDMSFLGRYLPDHTALNSDEKVVLQSWCKSTAGAKLRGTSGSRAGQCLPSENATWLCHGAVPDDQERQLRCGTVRGPRLLGPRPHGLL